MTHDEGAGVFIAIVCVTALVILLMIVPGGIGRQGIDSLFLGLGEKAPLRQSLRPLENPSLNHKNSEDDGTFQAS